MIKQTKAFTLIELLVVISIIGIIISLSIFGIQGARESSRDARRRGDLELIRSGLEIYRSDCDKYPLTGQLDFGSNLSGDDSVPGCNSGNVYISLIPTDPVSTLNYTYSGTTTSYVLCASLEQGGSGDATGCGNCGSAACNYKVVNP